MYFPYFRGRQYELLALKELAQKKLINKKPIVASEEEQHLNNRSTCAKLRIVEKL